MLNINDLQKPFWRRGVEDENFDERTIKGTEEVNTSDVELVVVKKGTAIIIAVANYFKSCIH